MEATVAEVENTTTEPTKNYTSRRGALIWYFRKSRDGWKRKYQELKASVKQLKNRVADVTKSREQWRLKAEETAARLAASQAEVAALRAADAARAEEKKAHRPVLR